MSGKILLKGVRKVTLIEDITIVRDNAPSLIQKDENREGYAL